MIPELIKSILVKDFHLFNDRKQRAAKHEILDKHLFSSVGEDWRRYRSIMSPTFTSGKMRKMFPIVRKCLNDFIDTLEPLAQKKTEINLKDMNGKYTMDVISSCAFATKTNSYEDPNDPFVKHAKNIFEFPFVRNVFFNLLPKIFSTIFNIKSANDETSNEFFFDMTLKVLNERKKFQNKNKVYNDFIQLLIDAELNNEELHDKNDINESHHVNDGNYDQEYFIIHI